MEFIAHSSTVSCASLGTKSAQVFVTGGDADDSRINLWRVGRPSSLLSICIGKTGVASATFDQRDEVVGAGSSGGVLRLVDLRAGSVRGALKGHRTACTSVDFHPYGDFVVSGSADSNVKVWDVRQQSCVRTYKGHKNEIIQSSFSPDGKWVVSSGRGGVVNVWDLTAGKKLHSFSHGTAAVVTLAFHPREFLLATGASKICRFWDLDRFESAGMCPADTGGDINCVFFNAEGDNLISLSREGIRSWSWEPVRCRAHIPVAFRGAVVDAKSLSEEEMMVLSVEGSPVSVSSQRLETSSVKTPIVHEPKEPARFNCVFKESTESETHSNGAPPLSPKQSWKGTQRRKASRARSGLPRHHDQVSRTKKYNCTESASPERGIVASEERKPTKLAVPSMLIMKTKK